MDEFKTYDELKSLLTIWAVGGDKIASAEKFDNNIKVLADNMVALWQKVDNAMKYNKNVQDGLNQIIDEHIISLERIRENTPETLDTLFEFATALKNDGDFANTVFTLINQNRTNLEAIINQNKLDTDISIGNLTEFDTAFVSNK